ncbi:hypothetical protein ULO1_05820 [Carboxydocella sp. ULO1]|nr:hypothetical protein ULO1_05820 [Carboxydocella sp. ULO1]
MMLSKSGRVAQLGERQNRTLEVVGSSPITSTNFFEGDLPNRAIKLVKEWAEKYQTELMAMWNNQEFRRLEGLE